MSVCVTHPIKISFLFCLHLNLFLRFSRQNTAIIICILEGLTEFYNIIIIPPQLLWNSNIHSQTSLPCISAFRGGSYNVIILMSHKLENTHISSSKLTMAWEVSRQLHHVYLDTFFFFFYQVYPLIKLSTSSQLPGFYNNYCMVHTYNLY